MSGELNRYLVRLIVRDWKEQAVLLKRIYPGFDLDQEVRNPEFLAMLRAGLSVRRAYEVLHLDEIKTVNVHVESQALV